MFIPKTLYLKAQGCKGFQDLAFIVDHLICAGWSGRDRQSLQAHIEELALLGIPRPSRFPIFMNLSPYLVTTDDEIAVVSDKSSGEVEYVLLCQGEEIWVTVASDHTDREMETHSIPASKQMYSKCLASHVWPYPDLKDHWDQLILRCWVQKGKERSLYQEAPLGSIIPPEELLKELPRDGLLQQEGLVLLSGTIPTQCGLVYGDSYDLEMEDPVWKRKIQYSYRVDILPQYV
jgi:Protein of unknown function (DUF2848)